MLSSRSLPWLKVISLAFSAFIFNTSEFVPVGLLSAIADSFHMRIADTGLMLTIYAWVVALASLPFMIVFSKTNRRHLLIGVFILFIASHALSAVAWSFETLMLSRIGVALAHSIFWSITAAIAMRIAPYGKKSQSLSLVIAGSAIATILGLPLGRMIGESFGWRTTFLIIGVIAALVLVVVYRLIPSLPSENSGSLSSLPLLMKRPALIGLYVLTVVIVTAHFTAYTYIEPLISQVMAFSGNFATSILFVFGIAGLLCSIFFSRVNKAYPLGTIFGSIAMMAFCMLVVLPMAFNEFSVSVICLLWGIGYTFMGLSIQIKILELAADATDVANSMYSGIFNLGIGGGALVGSQVIIQTQLANVGYVGGCIGTVALVWGLAFCLHFMRKPCLNPAS